MVAAATETARYRSEWRSTGVGPRYSGWAHLAFTSLSCWAGIAFAISRIRHPSWAELATFPLGFLIANAAEYFGHRGPMHRPRWPLETIFRRHAVEHHQFFTHREMAYETSRDFKMVPQSHSRFIFWFHPILAGSSPRRDWAISWPMNGFTSLTISLPKLRWGG